MRVAHKFLCVLNSLAHQVQYLEYVTSTQFTLKRCFIKFFLFTHNFVSKWIFSQLFLFKMAFLLLFFFLFILPLHSQHRPQKSKAKRNQDFSRKKKQRTFHFLMNEILLKERINGNEKQLYRERERHTYRNREKCQQVEIAWCRSV